MCFYPLNDGAGSLTCDWKGCALSLSLRFYPLNDGAGSLTRSIPAEDRPEGCFYPLNDGAGSLTLPRPGAFQPVPRWFLSPQRRGWVSDLSRHNPKPFQRLCFYPLNDGAGSLTRYRQNGRERIMVGFYPLNDGAGSLTCQNFLRSHTKRSQRFYPLNDGAGSLTKNSRGSLTML